MLMVDDLGMAQRASKLIRGKQADQSAPVDTTCNVHGTELDESRRCPTCKAELVAELGLPLPRETNDMTQPTFYASHLTGEVVELEGETTVGAILDYFSGVTDVRTFGTLAEATAYASNKGDDMTHYAEASKFRPVSARENLARMDREGAEGETSGPLFVHGYSLSEAIDVAQETGRRFVVRSHAGTQWATNTLATGYPGDDVILWCASDALGEALNHGNEA